MRRTPAGGMKNPPLAGDLSQECGERDFSAPGHGGSRLRIAAIVSRVFKRVWSSLVALGDGWCDTGVTLARPHAVPPTERKRQQWRCRRMERAPKGGSGRHRLPSIRARFVTRARTVRERPPFRQALEHAAMEWTRRHPAYAAGQDAMAPDLVLDSLPFVFVPLSLASALKRATSDALDGLLQVEGDWESLVRELCERWWPPAYYPDWSGYTHPAAGFVSACLIFKPQLVPEDWIHRQPAGLRILRYAPPTYHQVGDEQYWRTAYMTLTFSLEFALARGRPLGQEWYQAIRQGVEQVAREAAELAGVRSLLFEPDYAMPEDAQVEINNDGVRWRILAGSLVSVRSPRGEILFRRALVARDEVDSRFTWHMPIFPGMTSSDWRAIEPQVLDRARANIASHVRDLAAQGKSIRAMADLVGLSRPQVRRLLDSGRRTAGAEDWAALVHRPRGARRLAGSR
jgi:hypothetical protein